jgi:hypothetical protein
MDDKPKTPGTRERYKRVPVYTKEHYGSPKPEPKKRTISVVLEVALLVGSIIAIFAFFLYPAIAPKRAMDIEKETNEWYVSGAYDLCEEHLKEKLRDPSSYERSGEIKVIQDNGKEKGIAWNFRSRNGFGGMNAEEGVCLIKKDKKWVAATIK